MLVTTDEAVAHSGDTTIEGNGSGFGEDLLSGGIRNWPTDFHSRSDAFIHGRRYK